MTTTDTPLPLDFAKLKQLAELGEVHNHAQLEAVRAAYGDDEAMTLHVVLLAMQLGAVLKVMPGSERAPDSITGIWSLMSVPFTLEQRRVQ
jgi:hypothetical protein